MKKLIIIIFTMLILSTQLTLAADWYVTQDGAGDLSGQPNVANAMPVDTFSALTGTGYAGDTFYFSGTIVWITVRISGTVGSPVILDGYYDGNCDPINAECSGAEIDNAGTYGIWSGGAEADYITIQDFRIKNTAHAIYFSHGSDHITIKRNYTHENQSAGIRVTCATSRCSYITVGGALGDGNKIENAGTANGENLSMIYRTDDVVVSHNYYVITDATTYGVEGMYFYDDDRVLVEYNTVVNINKSSSPWGETGIGIKGQNNDFIVRFNKVISSMSGATIVNGMNGGYVYGNNFSQNSITGLSLGTQVGDAADAHLTNIYIWSNLMYENYARGLSLQAWDCSGYSCTASNIYIYNNTIPDNGGVSGQGITDAGFQCLTGTNINVKNNIFYNNLNTTPANQEIYTTNGGNIVLGNNNYYYPLGAVTLTGISMEGDAEEASPEFTNAAGNDYTLNGTNNINEGTDLGGVIATVTIQGTGYVMDYKWSLNPDTTDWITIPPTVNVLDRDIVGWSRGAYAYQTSGIIPIVLRQFFLD